LVDLVFNLRYVMYIVKTKKIVFLTYSPSIRLVIAYLQYSESSSLRLQGNDSRNLFARGVLGMHWGKFILKL